MANSGVSRRVSLSIAEARRIALAAQGFQRDRPSSRVDARHFRRALRAIGVLQLDFVNVLIPAHFLMIWSRLGAYDRVRFERFLYDSREFIEQWAHEASVVSIEDWPLLSHRRREFSLYKSSALNNYRKRRSYLENVLLQVREQGALTAHDLPPVKTPKGKPGDWHRPIPRSAVDYHFGRGALAVRTRQDNFQRVYDLPQRLIDEPHLSQTVDRVDAERALVAKSADRLGIATARDIADYYRMKLRDVEPRLAELCESGDISSATVEGWEESAYLSSSAVVPRAMSGACLLSPFDPVVWYRPRAERLFGFEYRIEIYVPANKRRWGYYVLPFRIGDGIRARVDLKADRAAGVLRVQGAYLEAGADAAEVASMLAQELVALANWLKLDDVTVEKCRQFEKTLAGCIRKV